jgi:hypothetical protein
VLKRVVVGSAIAATSWYAFYRVTSWWKSWGHDPAEAASGLPGDHVVPDAAMMDTRGITIDAPPASVWPWIVQLGYGRGGWYSYDVIDMKGRSADQILPEFQSLAVGDLVPTDPAGGFVVQLVEPERALVLLVDSEIAARQRGPAAAGATETQDEGPAGLEASGRFLQASMPPEFAVSWAFVLEPRDGGRRTRLVERIRGRFGSASSGSRLLSPALGFGMFLMTQRQLRGIKRRAERWPAVGTASGDGAPAPVEAASGTLQA